MFIRVISKKILTLLLLILLTGAGCQKRSGDISTSAKVPEGVMRISAEPITFTMLYSDNASYAFNPEWLVLQEMTRLTNVTLDIEPVPESDWDTKRQLVLNSGNIHDIVTKTNGYQVRDYIDVDLLLPINKYEDQMPHFTAFIMENGLQEEVESMTEEDGNYYGLPIKCFTQRVPTQVWSYRQDLLKKFGLSVPDTYEDLLIVSRSLKEIYPDSYPLTNRFGMGNLLSIMAPSFGTRAGWGLTNSGFTYDTDLDEWYFSPASEEYKAMLIWLNLMMEEGLLDPEFTTLDSNVYEQRIESGQTFFMADWLGNEIRYHKNARESEPDFSIAPMMPPAGPWRDRAVRGVRYAVQGWVIPRRVASEESFDTFLAFLDWFYSEEGIILFAWGVEEITFNVDEAGQKSYVPQFATGEWDPSKDFGFLNNCLTAVYPFDAYLARQNEASRLLLQRMSDEGAVPGVDPKLRPTRDEQRDIKEVEVGLSDYYNRMTLKFIYGEEAFDKWDEYVTNCQKKGSEKIGSIINSVWDRQSLMQGQ